MIPPRHFVPASRPLVSALAWLALVCCAIAPASAGVTIAGTRVIYPAQQREVAVKLSNAGERAALVQVWVDDGDPKQSPDTSRAPFLVTPPVARIEPGKGQTLRLIYSGPSVDAGAPTDAAEAARESVYWLNMLEIPPGADPSAAGQNQLQIAFRTRIKIFLRPPGLPGDAQAAAAQLQWRSVRTDQGRWALEARNPSRFHVSINRVALQSPGIASSDQGGMVAPGGALRFELPGLAAAAAPGSQVEYTVINDHGGRTELRAKTVD